MMERALAGIVLCLALLGPAAAEADEVSARQARIVRLEADQARLLREKAALEKRFDAETRQIEALKRKRPSWNRDRKLEKLLAESRVTATALDRAENGLDRLGRSLDKERRALVAAIDRALVAAAPEEQARLSRLRAAQAAKLVRKVKKIRIADERIDPLDDPEDLETKAAALARSERVLLEESAKMARRADHYARVARLEKNRRRTDALDVFHDDQPRRRSGQGSGLKVNATGDGQGQAGDPASPSADEGFDGAENPPPQDPGGGGASPDAVSTAELTVIYADVVETGTLDALRRAARSGDPEELARAAAKAREDLRRRAERLKKRRLEMEARAGKLRSE